MKRETLYARAWSMPPPGRARTAHAGCAECFPLEVETETGCVSFWGVKHQEENYIKTTSVLQTKNEGRISQLAKLSINYSI